MSTGVPIGSFIARILVWLIPGWVIFEFIREFNRLFSLSLNPYLAIVPTALAYIFQEIVIKRWKADDELQPNRLMRSGLDRVFYFIAWILLVSFSLAILALWAGAIYKQIVTSYDNYNAPMKWLWWPAPKSDTNFWVSLWTLSLSSPLPMNQCSMFIAHWWQYGGGGQYASELWGQKFVGFAFQLFSWRDFLLDVQCGKWLLVLNNPYLFPVAKEYRKIMKI